MTGKAMKLSPPEVDISRPESSAIQTKLDFFEKYFDLIIEFSLNVFPFSAGLLRLKSDVEKILIEIAKQWHGGLQKL